MAIGENIRKRREGLGMKLRELAAKLEVSEAYLCRIELGHVIPGGTKIVEIARALDTTPNDLLGFECPCHSNQPAEVAQ